MNVRLKTTHGDIDIALDPARAPITTENFLEYVRDGFYGGTLFHRVIGTFMIQGGGFEPGMTQKPTRAPITNEADNGLVNEAGTVAMARTRNPHSASAQFFINTSSNDFLNHKAKTDEGWGYCVFGKVTSGMDVVIRIGSSATCTRGGHSDVPVDDVVIEQAEILDT